MISVGTVLKVSDNSGARLVKCIHIYKRKKKGRIGDNILVSVIQKELIEEKALFFNKYI